MADELIKRSAALEALGERPLSWTDSDSELAEARQWEYDYHAVKAVPAVDAVPVVHGHWIQVGVYDSNDNCTFECSCCHTGDTHARSVIVPYCWKCGARMDGKDEA